MTIKQMQEILSNALLAWGDIDVMVNTATFPESENGTIMEVDKAHVEDVQGADDSGPVGDNMTMLVIKGAIDMHEHGDPIMEQHLREGGSPCS
jgi:hypothetical protein